MCTSRVTPRSGPRTTIYPFASLGTPPQSVQLSRRPTRLVVGADCEIRESVTMNTGTEDGGGVTTVGDDCLSWSARMSGTTAKSATTSPLPTTPCLAGIAMVGDHVFHRRPFAPCISSFASARAHDRGMTGVCAPTSSRSDSRLAARARLDGLNVVGMRRRGCSRKDAIRAVQQAYRAVRGAGQFHGRVERPRPSSAMWPVVAKIIAFIRDGSASRPHHDERGSRAAWRQLRQRMAEAQVMDVRQAAGEGVGPLAMICGGGRFRSRSPMPWSGADAACAVSRCAAGPTRRSLRNISITGSRSAKAGLFRGTRRRRLPGCRLHRHALRPPFRSAPASTG